MVTTVRGSIRRTQTASNIPTSFETPQLRRSLQNLLGRFISSFWWSSGTKTTRSLVPCCLHFQNVLITRTKIPNTRSRNARHHARIVRMEKYPHQLISRYCCLYRSYWAEVFQGTPKPLLSTRQMEY